MSSRPLCCQRPDIRKFDGIRTCLACGTAVFESPSTEIAGNLSADSNTEGTQTYRYTKLNYELGQEIRLLVIQPGSEKDPVRCNIITVNLMDEPEYEALSYTWATEDGDDSLSRVVYCDNFLTTLHVTRNCEAALRRLRRLGLRRTVWIDALCVDQNNIAERNHQVALMGNIYKGASKVLIYLDCATYNLTALFEWLRLKEINWESPKSRLHPERNSSWISILQVQVKELLSLRWFHRVWVIQEVALSRAALLMTENDEVILDGETVTRLQDIRRKKLEDNFATVRGHNDLSLPGPLLWMPGWRELQRPDLLECLLATQDCSESDPRDKVYGILNLLDDEAQSLIQVDYALDILTVYMHATVSTIIQRRDTRALLYACKRCDATVSATLSITSSLTAGQPLPKSNSPGELSSAAVWPSWVPDWRSTCASPLGQCNTTTYRDSTKRLSSPVELIDTPLSWPVTGDTNWSAQHPPSIPPTMKHCLRLRARFLDSINCRDWTSDTSLWVYVHCSNLYSGNPGRRNNFLHVVRDSRGQEHRVFDSDSFPTHLEIVKLKLKCLPSSYGIVKDCINEPQHYEAFLETGKTLPDEGAGYKVFRTKHSMGFADYSPTSWTKGDVIVALDGAHAPMILQSLGGNRYRIKCDCYLMAALEYDSWKEAGGRGPWGELPDPVPEEEHTRLIDLY